MTYKPLPLTDELHAYLLAHGTPPDDVTADLISETRAAGSGRASTTSSSCGSARRRNA
jgi:caffeoyl-CoA O-methyltransferase